MKLCLRDITGDRIVGTHDDKPLFEYVYNPIDVPKHESPKPYFHPLYSLAGDLVTGYRPTDHPWHKGLAMTLTAVNDQNFWGGPTFNGKFYEQQENVGSVEHVKFGWIDDMGQIVEDLLWKTAGGETWLREQRAVRFTIDPEAGRYSISWQSHFENVSGKTLQLGSPTTQGRDDAGYTGLFWRGPRSFADGAMVFNAAEDFEPMGKASPWVAFIGQHDETLRPTTLVFRDAKGNPSYPTPWFVRTRGYAGVSFAFSFHKPYHLHQDKTLYILNQVVVANGAMTAKEISTLVGNGNGHSEEPAAVGT